MQTITRIFTLLAAFVTGIFVTYLFQNILLSKINQVDVLIENDAILTKPEVIYPVIEDEKPDLSLQANKQTAITTEDKKSVTSRKEDVKNTIEKVIPNKSIAKKETKIEKIIDTDKNKEKNIKTDKGTIDKKITTVKKSTTKASRIDKPNGKKKIKKVGTINSEELVAVKTMRNTENNQDTKKGFEITYLMKKYWFNDYKPSIFLPSSLNSCLSKNINKLICNSQIMEEERFGSVVSFKVKSIITKNENSADRFFITYRNLILDVKDPENGTSFKTAPVKTGWSKKHTVDCEYTGNESISCVKNNEHKIEINGKDR